MADAVTVGAAAVASVVGAASEAACGAVDFGADAGVCAGWLVLLDAVGSGCAAIGAGGTAASWSGVGAVAAGACVDDGSTGAAAAAFTSELAADAASDGAEVAGAGAGVAMTEARMIDASVAASFEALSELSVSSLLSSSSSAWFEAALVDDLDGAGASVGPLSFDAFEDDAFAVLDELEPCDEFVEAAALAAPCVDWFLGPCCEDGCACGCGLAFAEDAGAGVAAAADDGVDWLAPGALMLPCRTLEKLCVGALLFAPAEGVAGAAGAALIVSKMESVINRAAYA